MSKVVRGLWLGVGYLGVILMGLFFMLWKLPCRFGFMAIARGITVAPWSMRYGCDVIIRCVAGVFLMELLLWLTNGPMDYSAGFLLGVPPLILMYYHVFRLDGSTPWNGFGTLPQNGPGLRLIVFTGALIAIDQLGCLWIQNGTTWIGLSQFWEEGIEKTPMFGSLFPVLVLSIDGIIRAPLLEELFFPGTVVCHIADAVETCVRRIDQRCFLRNGPPLLSGRFSRSILDWYCPPLGL